MAETIVTAIRFTVIIGSTFVETVTWKDATGELVPLPTGTIAEAIVRPALSSTDVLIRFHTSPGPTDGTITLTDPGLTTLSLTAAKTALLRPIKDAVFDVRYVFANGTVIVKLSGGQGIMDIQEASTRA